MATDAGKRLLPGRHVLRSCGRAGALGGLLALAVTGAGALGPGNLAFAPVSLAERLIRVTPGDLATFGIENLGKDAIPALAVAAAIALVAMAAAVAVLVRGRPALGGPAMGVLLLVIALTSPTAPGLAASTIAAGLAAAAYALVLAGSKPERVPRSEAGEPPVTYGTRDTLPVPRDPAAPPRATRRGVMAGAGALVLAGAAAGRGLAALQGSPGPVRLARPARRAPLPSRGPFPAAASLPPEITSAGAHYVVDIDVVDPIVDPADWSLRVDGLVASPVEMGVDGLQRTFRVVEEYSVLTCISNEVGGELVGNSLWTGVRLRDVLRRARPRPGAQGVVFHAADGYTVSVPLERALEPAALLAFGQAGRPLTRKHGSPCRVRIPALYGMMNAKWVRRIQLVDGLPAGYWAKRGWSPTGEVQTQARIDALDGPMRAGREHVLAGVAWAGEREIARVEASFDGGRSWRVAQLRDPLSPVSWTQWAVPWVPESAGTYSVLCRATDGQGQRQGKRRRSPHPDGATGYHRVAVNVRAGGA